MYSNTTIHAYYLKVDLDQKIPLNVIQYQCYPNDQIYLQYDTVKADLARIQFRKVLPSQVIKS